MTASATTTAKRACARGSRERRPRRSPSLTRRAARAPTASPRRRRRRRPGHFRLPAASAIAPHHRAKAAAAMSMLATTARSLQRPRRRMVAHDGGWNDTPDRPPCGTDERREREPRYGVAAWRRDTASTRDAPFSGGRIWAARGGVSAGQLGGATHAQPSTPRSRPAGIAMRRRVVRYQNYERRSSSSASRRAVRHASDAAATINDQLERRRPG